MSAVAVAAFLLLAATAVPALGEEVAALDLIRQPGSYSGRYITVRGAIMNVQPATVGGVIPSTAVIFDLVDGPAILRVLSAVRPACRIGSAVSVDGRFAPMSQFGAQVYANVLEATVVNCR